MNKPRMDKPSFVELSQKLINFSFDGFEMDALQVVSRVSWCSLLNGLIRLSLSRSRNVLDNGLDRPLRVVQSYLRSSKLLIGRAVSCVNPDGVNQQVYVISVVERLGFDYPEPFARQRRSKSILVV
jgi:hypothetical protein